MSQQTARQAARRAALDAQSRRRKERAAKEKRLSELAVTVMVALVERDAAVAACEQRAGAALRTMVEVEGLTVREAVQWCDEKLTAREATRLRALRPAAPAEAVPEAGPRE